jgi:hypothetical protein
MWTQVEVWRDTWERAKIFAGGIRQGKGTADSNELILLQPSSLL